MVRIELSNEDYEALVKLLEKRNKTLKKKIEASYEKYQEILSSKQKATKIATKSKINQVKEKIIRAVKELEKENQAITIYQVAKRAGISFNTSKKYKEFIKNLINDNE